MSIKGKMRCGVTVAVVILLFTAALFGSYGCGAKQVVDKVYVTVRGYQVIQDVNAKAEEGYDVRTARAMLMEGWQAYNEDDFGKTNELINKLYDELKKSRRVAERIYYSSAGGITVSGLVFKPQGKGPWPTIIVNHAGFGTAADFSDVALGICDRGYLVFNPDFRGSGKSEGVNEFAKGEVDDVINGLDYLEEQGWVDNGRIGTYGQSHGAAVSLLAAERDSRIKAVVEEAGPTDAVTLYEEATKSTDPTEKQLIEEAVRMVGGTPSEVPQEYAIRSAVNYADQISAPVLIIHGAQDNIVPVEQAYEMYDALERAGKTVEMKIYPEELHCINQPDSRNEVWEMMFDWFSRYV